MVECIQNHTPGVMVVDEIGRSAEVEAALTCKQRGVRLIASAHGDFRKLMKNPKLRGLIGGVETIILGDAQAKLETKNSTGSGISKLKAQRSGAPIFDVIVELRWGLAYCAGYSRCSRQGFGTYSLFGAEADTRPHLWCYPIQF
jgi:stage III sporulation protein SpoIIIAA